MKVRTDFVTNSSSSSFVVTRKRTPEWIMKLLDRHDMSALERALRHQLQPTADHDQYGWWSDFEGWSISSDEVGDYEFSTSMDNFYLMSALADVGAHVIDMEDKYEGSY